MVKRNNDLEKKVVVTYALKGRRKAMQIVKRENASIRIPRGAFRSQKTKRSTLSRVKEGRLTTVRAAVREPVTRAAE